MQTGFNRCMNTCIVAGFEQRCRQFWLHKGFTARQGETPAAAIVKRFITHYGRHDVVHAFFLSADGQRLGWTAVGQRRERIIGQFFAMNQQSTQRAFNHLRCGLSTEIATVEAQTRVIEQILRAGAAFRILAPPTAQRASLKEHHGTDTGTIMCGIALDIENHKRPLVFRIKIKLLSNESYIDVRQLTVRFRRATFYSC